LAHTNQFPQADEILKVGSIAEAVSNSNHTDIELERFIGLNSKGRQGRYYRHAAELLGLITNIRNYATLTELGAAFCQLTNENEKLDYLARCVIGAPIFGEALNFIEANHPDQAALRSWYDQNWSGKTDTANRRYTTFQNYLINTKLVALSGSKYVPSKFLGAWQIIKGSVPDQLPKSFLEGLLPKKPLPMKATKITHEIDPEKLETASLAHWKMIEAKANALSNMKLKVFTLGQIDLVASNNDATTFYEMKSIAKGGVNFQSQIRKAVAQLYEYRYRAKAPDANLVIVTNAPVPDQLSWMQNYLVEDRRIGFEWTLDFAKFDCSDASKELLKGFI
jgi:hypothetical protein